VRLLLLIRREKSEPIHIGGYPEEISFAFFRSAFRLSAFDFRPKPETGLADYFFVLCSAMFLATTNKSRRLLFLHYIGTVSVAELERGYQEIKVLLVEFPNDFEMLADLSRLDFMDVACAEIIGQTMELMDQHGVEIVVRVIPDPAKDIGLNIISIFHYPNHPRIVTCQTLTEAAQVLAL